MPIKHANNINAIFQVMTKTIKEQVKETFRTMPFTEAVAATIDQRKQLCHIMKECHIYRMCVETSKWAGMYNLKR